MVINTATVAHDACTVEKQIVHAIAIAQTNEE